MQELIKDIVKYLPTSIIPALIGLVTIPIITRLFLPADYGNYVLVTMTVSIMYTFSIGWLDSAIIRFFPFHDSDEITETFCRTVIISAAASILIMSTLFGCILFLLKSYIHPELYSLMRLGILVFIVTAFFTVFIDFFRARRQVNIYTFFSIWKSVMALVLGLIFIVGLNYGIDGLLWGTVIAIGACLPFLGKMAFGKIRLQMSKNLSLPLITAMAAYGFPLLTECLADWILALSDRYILGLFCGAREVGLYAASYDLSNKCIFLIISLLMMAAGPIVIQLWEKEGENAAKDFMKNFSRYYFMFCLPATVGLSVLAKYVIHILVGLDYQEAYKIVPFIAFAEFMFGFQWLLGYGLMLHKKTKIIAACAIAACLLNLCLNVLLIPFYGYLAAAINILISYIVLLILITITSRRVFAFCFPLQSFMKIAFSSTLMGIAVYFIGNSLAFSNPVNLILTICMGTLIYFLILVLIKELQIEEIQQLWQMISFNHTMGKVI